MTPHQDVQLRPKLTRSVRFRIAAAIAGTSQAKFGARFGVTDAAINRVLHGQARSRRLEAEIDRFINEQFGRLFIWSLESQQNGRQQDNPVVQPSLNAAGCIRHRIETVSSEEYHLPSGLEDKDRQVDLQDPRLLHEIEGF